MSVSHGKTLFLRICFTMPVFNFRYSKLWMVLKRPAPNFSAVMLLKTARRASGEQAVAQAAKREEAGGCSSCRGGTDCPASGCNTDKCGSRIRGPEL